MNGRKLAPPGGHAAHAAANLHATGCASASARAYLSWKARRDSVSKTGAVQLIIFAFSNKIDPIVPHSENSRDHFCDKHAKFFLVYVCAAGFVAFSI
ncbi:hypothetical protein [Burkholderia stagnalis]|uniref:hypothetical protein n=1 Tax=Burkholderia stagnalis TaxID=1503054 RepID=UPI0012DA1B46|nr:hypothetical protein [Burkholderia stagnalis]